RMPNVFATSGASSTFTFASTNAPACCWVSRSSTGPSVRQGPHQGAQKSTTTGSFAERSSTAAVNSASATSTMEASLAMAETVPKTWPTHKHPARPPRATDPSAKDGAAGAGREQDSRRRGRWRRALRKPDAVLADDLLVPEGAGFRDSPLRRVVHPDNPEALARPERPFEIIEE